VGARLHGQWSAVAGGTVSTLVEASDPLVAVQCFQGWNSLGEFDMFSLIDTDAFVKDLAKLAIRPSGVSK